MNPFLQLEARLAALLAAHPYFDAQAIITEEEQNLEGMIEAELARSGFCAVITMGRGDCGGDTTRDRALDDRLEFTVAISRNATMETSKHTLHGLWAAIAAINGQVVDPTRDRRGQDIFQVTGHDSGSTAEAPEGLYVQQLNVAVRSRLDVAAYTLPMTTEVPQAPLSNPPQAA
ncbi:MAG: hypothetical protein IPL39_14445 [Opitutaceae bacterium]|nr:hypothetical protein [Opitutaceae bacterium]